MPLSPVVEAGDTGRIGQYLVIDPDTTLIWVQQPRSRRCDCRYAGAGRTEQHGRAWRRRLGTHASSSSSAFASFRSAVSKPSVNQP